MARGRRDPSCLYNLGRSEVVTLTLCIKFKPVSTRVTSVAQEARNHMVKIQVLFNLSEKPAEPTGKTTITRISQKAVLGEHHSWISLG